MCTTCDFIDAVFLSAQEDRHFTYVPVLTMLFEIEKQGRIDLIAGDCLSDQLHTVNEVEVQLTVCHYFKCRTCKKYFFIGSYIRGTPTFRSLTTLKNEHLDKKIWGKFGLYFADRPKASH